MPTFKTSYSPLLAVACLAFFTPVAHADTKVRTGHDAYGDWQSDAPGVMRRITPSDLPAPSSTYGASNPSRVVARPANAQLRTLPGFHVTAFATGLPGARIVRVAPNGDIFVAQSRAGKITVLRAPDGAPKPSVTTTFASGLNQPYGIAFTPPGVSPAWVYIGETTRVVRYPYTTGDLVASGPPEVIVSGLPRGGHWTRDIAFSPDGATLYVAVGSESNVAEDLPAAPRDLAAWESSHGVGAAWGSEEGRATVLAFDADGQNRRVVATGVRNCSGIAVGASAVFCATNERDMLGDDLPPDYVTALKPGAFYGWPWFYIGAHPDPRHPGARADLAHQITIPDTLLQPHSAPLGLAINPGRQFPAAWKGDLFVALHGSWNRAKRTGYKIVRVPVRDGKPTGDYEDVVTGFAVDGDSVWGRPVGVAFARDGSLLFSDDAGGVVWRVSPDGT